MIMVDNVTFKKIVCEKNFLDVEKYSQLSDAPGSFGG
jgi:hypothetical protein